MKSLFTAVEPPRCRAACGEARRRAPALLALLAAIAGAARPARGQSTAKDASVAQALFDAARVLMDEGKLDDACAKLAESQRIDPAPGTLLNLAVCHEQQGKTATAWTEYNDVLAIGRKDGNVERQRIAAERIRALEPRLARLTINLAKADLAATDLVIRLDALAIGRAAVGVAIPVDPSPHTVEVSARGKRSWSRAVSALDAGASEVVTVPRLEDAPVTAPGSGEGAANPGEPRQRGAAERPFDLRRRTMYTLAATGLLAFAATGYFGYLSKSEDDVRRAHCSPDCDNPSAEDARQRALTLAHAADVAAGVGLIAAGVAAYLFLTPGAAPASTASKQAFIGPSLAVTSQSTMFAYRGEF